MPRTLKIGLDLESGLIEEDSATFRLLDIDGTVPAFFGGLDKPYQQLGQRLPAGSTPIAAPLVGANEDSLPADEGGYLGTEAIGPNGERNYYSHVPWASMPGQDHPATDEPFPVFTTRDTGPLLVEGRRVALYRIIFDPDTGTWPSFDDQFIGGRPMLWWGTLRQAGKVEGRIWSINCAGPGSWLRRSLANRAPTSWFPVASEVQFADNERKVYLDFYKTDIYGFDYWYGHDVASYSVPDGSPSAVASYLSSAISTVAGTAGQDGVWTADVPVAGAASSIEFDLLSVTVSTLADCGYAARLVITLHIRAWRLLGWEPLYEPGSLSGPQPLFVDSGDGYYTAYFATVPPGSDPVSKEGGPEWTGEGIPRIYTPLYPGGVSVLSGLGGQVVSIATENLAPLYVESQTIRARPPFAEIDGTDTDSWRLWAFRGPIQLAGEDEPVDTVQVARCSWVSDGYGLVADDASGIRKGLHISGWLDPRLFGLNFEPINKWVGWASNDNADDDEGKIQASPLSFFGVYYNRPDRAADTIIRTLVSTGTGAWDPAIVDTSDDFVDGYSASWFTEGENPTGLAYPAMDAEIYDLSLQIPAAMIDLASFAEVGADLPGGESGPLAMGKVAVQGTSIQSEELLGALMAPRGWCFSLKRGKFGLFAPHLGSEAKYDDAVDFEITESDLHGEAGDPASTIPEVELRPVFPFDRMTVDYTGDPTEGWLEGQSSYEAKARDPGARARSGTRKREVKAPDLIATEWFVGDKAKKVELVQSWQNDLKKLWEVGVASWLSRPHRLLTGLRVSRPKGQDIYPGAILKLTNPWPANSTGSYGVTGGYARVLSVTHETDSCACEIECLLEGGAPNALRWAPVFRVVDEVSDTTERYDPATRKFYVQAWG
ncbi:MAG: hypothetical protein E6Q97_31750, partial [Desulfurellales bacterium]